MLCHNVKDYVKKCNIYLALKVVQHKPYDDLQSLPVSIHCWKNLLMNFVNGLLVSTDWKEDNYDSILVIINHLIKMIYYKLIKVTINALGLATVIINVIVRHYSILTWLSPNKSCYSHQNSRHCYAIF